MKFVFSKPLSKLLYSNHLIKASVHCTQSRATRIVVTAKEHKSSFGVFSTGMDDVLTVKKLYIHSKRKASS